MLGPYRTVRGDCVDSRLPISRGYSTYLDFFRVASALVVVGAHATMPVISGHRYMFPFGEDAVEAFFVLSGFVIASVADGREATFRLFAIARLSRLWSVLIPALLLGPILVHLALHFWHDGYLTKFQGSILSSEFGGSIASAFFVNEIWFVSLTPETNLALWSIGFEFWYYAMFAVYAFGSRRLRWAGIAIMAAIVGPQILLLMPGWVLGALLYRLRSRIRMRKTMAAAVFIASPMLVLMGHLFHWAAFMRGLYLPFLGSQMVIGDIFFARDFLWQNLVGLAFAAHLAAAYVLLRDLDEVPNAFRTAVRGAAGTTYSIYLLHFPAELVLTSRLYSMRDGLTKVALVGVGATIISASFGLVLERLKRPLRSWMTRIVDRAFKTPAPVPVA